MKKNNLFNELFSELSEADILAADLRHQVSRFIRNKRIELGMTQKQFAEYMDVTQGMVSKWESFSYNFSLEHIAAIFSKLKIDISFKANNASEEYENNITRYEFNPACTYTYSNQLSLNKGA